MFFFLFQLFVLKMVSLDAFKFAICVGLLGIFTIFFIPCNKFFSWCRDGCDAFVPLFLLKELILINSFFLRVSYDVFNLSFCHFLSLSLWLIYYGKL